MKYRFCIDGFTIKDRTFLTELKPHQIDRVKAEFAKEYGLSSIAGVTVHCIGSAFTKDVDSR